MSGSSTSVNYNVRPCKSIERRMMCEIISCLTPFKPLYEYRYIGMGAKYFADFSLIHKEFGINRMYSMEINSEENNKKRFEFNKPFNCIKMVFGNSADILNSMQFEWKGIKNIIWLDYDGGINANQLQDVETCVGKIDSGSMVFVSFNSNFGNKFKKASPKEKLDIFCSRIDNETLVKLLSPKDVSKERIYKTINQMFRLVVQNKISERNGIIQEERDKFRSQQVAYFKYNDSATTMLTLGWIVYKKEDEECYKKCNFNKLDFYNDTDIPYDITVPNFTYKELTVLNRNMPDVEYPIKEAEFFAEDEIEAYRKIYRYYPTIFETSLVL